MGRIKGAREQKLRDDYDFSPKNWLDKRSMVFFSKGVSKHSGENLKRMDKYLCDRKARTEWRKVNCNGEIALLATIDSNQRYLRMIQHEAMPNRCDVSCYEWAPVKGGESLRQNIPLRTFPDLIRNDNPSEWYRIYIVSENDTIFYVGQAENPISRICRRLNPYDGETNDKQFTNFLRRYIDDALSTWKIQLLTLQDCESLVVESLLMPQFDTEIIRSEIIEKYKSPSKKDMEWAMNQAERVLIWLYQPCKNNIYTPFPKQLPAKYSDFSVSYSHVLQSP